VKTQNTLLQTFIVSTGLLLFVTASKAQHLFDNPGGHYDNFIATNTTVGASFTVGNQSILVTALGVYDADLDGLSESHTVGIWGNSSLLNSTTIPSGTSATLDGSFRYVVITPFTLLANTTYTIGAKIGYVNSFPFDSHGVDGGAILDPAFSSASPNLFAGHQSGFAEPTQTFFTSVWGANLQYTAVPEPSILALVIWGFSAFAVRSRKRI
jgi:hypothetical protein